MAKNKEHPGQETGWRWTIRGGPDLTDVWAPTEPRPRAARTPKDKPKDERRQGGKDETR